MKEQRKYSEKTRYQRLSVLQKWIFKNWDKIPERISRAGLSELDRDLQEFHTTKWVYSNFFGHTSNNVSNSLVCAATHSLACLQRRGLLELRFRDTLGYLCFCRTSRGLLVGDHLNFVHDAHGTNTLPGTNNAHDPHNANTAHLTDMMLLLGCDPQLTRLPEQGLEGVFLGQIQNPTTYFYICLIKTTSDGKVKAVRGEQPLDVVIGEMVHITPPRTVDTMGGSSGENTNLEKKE